MWTRTTDLLSVNETLYQLSYDSKILSVPGRGLEPPRPCGHSHLKATCIPFHHPGLPLYYILDDCFLLKNFLTNLYASQPVVIIAPTIRGYLYLVILCLSQSSKSSRLSFPASTLFFNWGASGNIRSRRGLVSTLSI